MWPSPLVNVHKLHIVLVERYSGEEPVGEAHHTESGWELWSSDIHPTRAEHVPDRGRIGGMRRTFGQERLVPVREEYGICWHGVRDKRITEATAHGLIRIFATGARAEVRPIRLDITLWKDMLGVAELPGAPVLISPLGIGRPAERPIH